MARTVRPPDLGRLRMAHVEDASLIMDLCNESMLKNFRIGDAADIVYLMNNIYKKNFLPLDIYNAARLWRFQEARTRFHNFFKRVNLFRQNCILSVCQMDAEEKIIGFIGARDYPLIPSVHPRAWEEYIWTKYKTTELCARNTMFIHLLCWHPLYARELVDRLLKSIFMHDPYVKFIAMVKTLPDYQLLVPGQSRCEGAFRRVQISERGLRGEIMPALCIADRCEVSPRLRIRRAVEEDNDDIVPIIENHSKMLRQIYGEFYISELISRHPESERVLLVCEHNELAVGVMCLNTQINYEALEESFDLSPFGGLRHLDAHSMSSPSAKLSDLESLCNSQINVCNHESTTASFADDVKPPTSRVTWLFSEDDFKAFHSDRTATTAHGGSSSHTGPPFDVLDWLDDEEDELEFDIVNIAADLLRVPKILTYDTLGKGLASSIMKILDDTAKKKESVISVDDKTPKKEKHRVLSTIANKIREYTRYTGPPNAFLLELFAMHQDYDERYGFDILEVAFELFPDRDYCVMCLPSKHTSIPLLEHFTLVTPFCSRIRFINETLYVAHVNSVRGDLSVRYGEASDMAYLHDILEHAPRAQSLLDLFESSIDSPRIDSYLLLSQKQPVGMVVLGPVEDGTAIRTQYALEPEPRRPGTDGTILAGVMSPAFEPHGRWFMRDLLRQSQYTTLFWICRLFAKGDVSASKNLMSLAGHMTPVLPRRSMPNISGNKNLDQIFQDVATPFALWVLEKPLTSLPKILINNNIVIVGASRTGLAFLETLIMGPTSQYLTFTNITLVSEHGLPTVVECLKAADTCVPREGRYSDRYLKSVPFYFYVDVMCAVMVSIDRKMKCIRLKGGGMKFYDQLVLTCGQQFQHPDYLHEPLELAKEVEKGKPCDRILMDNPLYQPDKVPSPPQMPENLMLINSLFDANASMKKLLRMISDTKDTYYKLSEENQVIVYGQCIEAYSCVAALLELGLAAHMIAFVEPFPQEDVGALRVNCFNNETVDIRVQESMKQLGVRVLQRCTLADWRQVDSRIDAIHLMAPLHALIVPCFALFYFGLKAIDINAFRAINECGLVYDGGLIVGPKFETNDPHIYAAGTSTRYSRRLYANREQHRFYCSEDVGEALARNFLHMLDPFMMCNPEMNSDDISSGYAYSFLGFTGSYPSLTNATVVNLGLSRRWQPVMRFESPIAQSSTMPGPLYYLIVHKPGPIIPMEVQLCLPHQGHILITDKRGNLFRLHLNSLHCVESLTCLSKKQFSHELLSQLYGKHEAFFNKLLARFMLDEIDDFFDFFTQPWMAALYQDTFSELLRDINEQDVGTVYELVRSRFSSTDKSRYTDLSQQFCASELYGHSGSKVSFMEQRNLGTFRSVIDKYVTNTRSSYDKISTKPVDIPSECGQSPMLRNDAATFWKTVGGESIVIAHISRYLSRHSVTNPHYAKPNNDDI